MPENTKKTIDFKTVLEGRYKETVEVTDNISVTLKPPTFEDRNKAAEKRDFEVGVRVISSQDRGRIFAKHMAAFVLKSVKIYEDTLNFEGDPDAVEKWLNGLPAPIAESICGSISDFISFYNDAAVKEWKQDPFGMESSSLSSPSPPKESE